MISRMAAGGKASLQCIKRSDGSMMHGMVRVRAREREREKE